MRYKRSIPTSDSKECDMSKPANSRSKPMSAIIMMLVTTLLAGFIAALTFAAPAQADPNGNCGGYAKTVSKLYKGWQKNHITKQAGKSLRSAGFSSIDGSLKRWLGDRVVLAKQAKPSRTKNNGCRKGRMFGAGTKKLPKGHKVFVALPSKWDKGDVSTKPHKGWTRVAVRVRIVADSGCSNPHSGYTTVYLYLPPKPHRSTPPPVKTCPRGSHGTPPHCVYPPPPPPAKASYYCIGLSATRNGPTGTLNYTFSVASQVSNTSVTGYIYTVNGTSFNGTTPQSYPFPNQGTYTVNAQVVTTAGTTPISPICSTTVSITPPPVVTPAPHILEVCTVNDVLISNTRTCTVSGTVAPGHTASLHASARNGGTITVGKDQTVSGSFTVNVTYLAPSEVPGANSTYNIAAGKDRIDFGLTQDDGQYDTGSTNQFVITQPVPDPQ